MRAGLPHFRATSPRQSVPPPSPEVPELPDAVTAGDLAVPDDLDGAGFDTVLSGAPHLWDD
ncbi:MAG: hypothetical protein ACE5FD_18760, partial [Anaerolineae bacterium]